jgi:NitT/TauT family transport system substrate-binding protein
LPRRGATVPNRSARRTARAIGALLLVGAMIALTAGCGGSSTEAGTGTGDTTPAASGEVLKIGYSAWPGWFPLAVAEKEGIFEKAGLKVELTYFAEYTASLDALVAGQIDVNAQTLNDTLIGEAADSDQKIVVVNDNSTGNDQIICDKSIQKVEDLKGRSIGVELGVVDHFLLLQGLHKAGLTEADVKVQGMATDAAAAAFANGEFDCVGVFAPFTVEAAKRPDSHVLFSSKDFPGVIPDHLVATAKAVETRPDDIQKLVDAWYLTLDHLKSDPGGSTATMAEKAALSTADYESLAQGTTLFDITKALNAFEDRAGDPTSLPEMARRINPFMVSSGIGPKEASLEGLFDPRFTKTTADKRGGK